VLVRRVTAHLGRRFCAAAVLLALGPAAVLLVGGRASASTGAATERTEISTAFARLFTGRLSAAGAGLYVQDGGGRLAASLDGTFESFVAGFDEGAARVSLTVRSVAPVSASVARVGFEFEVSYRGGVYRQTFTGAAVAVGGRWRVGWATACFVEESSGGLCPSAPRNVALGPIPTMMLPARFAHPSAAGLIWPSSLAVAQDGSLVIVDSSRNQVFRRLRDGRLQLVAGTGATGFGGDGGPATAAEFDDISGIATAPDGTIYLTDTANGRVRVIAPHGTISTLAAHLRYPSGIARASDGTLYVATNSGVVTITASGVVTTFAAGKGPDREITVGTTSYRGFSPDWITVSPAGDLYVFSSRVMIEFSPSGVAVRAWNFDANYVTGLAAAAHGKIIISAFGPALTQIVDGHHSLFLLFTKTAPVGFPTPRPGAFFDPGGIAVAPDGTIYTDTDVGDGWTDQTALAQITPAGQASIIRITTPLTDTLPTLGEPGFPAALYPEPLPPSVGSQLTACPAPTGLQAFDPAARAAAITTAQLIDTGFYQGLRRSDRSWWAGLYTDQIDGLYGGGRHKLESVSPAADDIYAPAIRHACGAALLQHSLAIIVGHSDYSDQVSHLYFLDRGGHALLYWQHT
jgi:hypothetical protein